MGMIYEDEETRELKKRVSEANPSVNWSEIFKEALKEIVSNNNLSDRIYYLQEKLEKLNYDKDVLEDRIKRIIKEINEIKEKRDQEKTESNKKETRKEEVKNKIEEQQEKEREIFNK